MKKIEDTPKPQKKQPKKAEGKTKEINSKKSTKIDKSLGQEAKETNFEKKILKTKPYEFEFKGQVIRLRVTKEKKVILGIEIESEARYEVSG